MLFHYIIDLDPFYFDEMKLLLTYDYIIIRNA